jgi:hypothetical protein
MPTLAGLSVLGLIAPRFKGLFERSSEAAGPACAAAHA